MIDPKLEAVLITLQAVVKVATITLDVAVEHDSRVTDWEREQIKELSEDLQTVGKLIEKMQ